MDTGNSTTTEATIKEETTESGEDIILQKRHVADKLNKNGSRTTTQEGTVLDVTTMPYLFFHVVDGQRLNVTAKTQLNVDGGRALYACPLDRPQAKAGPKGHSQITKSSIYGNKGLSSVTAAYEGSTFAFPYFDSKSIIHFN